MYQDDYLTRTLKQFADTLAALLGARVRGEPPSFGELDELSWSFTGLGLKTLLSLSAPQLLQLFSVGGELDVNKAYISAQLLCQLARDDASQDSAKLHREALQLLNAVSLHLGDYLNEEHRRLSEELESELSV